MTRFNTVSRVGVVHTAISRKVVGKKCERDNPKTEVIWDENYAVPDTVAVESSIAAFL